MVSNVQYSLLPAAWTNQLALTPVSVFHLHFCLRPRVQRRTIIINIKICAICYVCMGFNEASEKAILNVNWSLKRKFIKDPNNSSQCTQKTWHAEMLGNDGIQWQRHWHTVTMQTRVEEREGAKKNKSNERVRTTKI